ncbi:MAG TPA: hypothetical protein VFC24_17810 [Casimicrobiaceae bacterium]|nr:hypothetical protein [Casimicrobiaceae bacterium]
MSSAPPRFESTALLPANAQGIAYGLYAATDFVVGEGAGAEGVTTRHARWYFRDETVALPKPGLPLPALTHGASAPADLQAWLARPHPAGMDSYPPLVWVAAPQVIAQARIDHDGTRVLAAEGAWKLELAPRLPLNKSYFNETSAAWFSTRPLRLRGATHDETFNVRTLWPKDFRLPRDVRRVERGPLPTTPEALRSIVRAEPHGGAASPFSVSLLWSRGGASYAVPTGRAVIALILNGAQADDDEAHGGHFGLITGRTMADGSIADWLVNNFYSLDIESEKGIIAAPVPLDNYLGDLNSGQGYYRPSTMLVAVLASDRAAMLLQAALNRTYVQFYRHQIAYDHAAMNCAGISVDVVRALGLPAAQRRPSARLGAGLALPFLVAHEWSVKKACAIYDYLTEDQTRLLPAAAFEEIGALLARIAYDPAAATGMLAQWLAQDMEALLFLRFPQLPSSRALGDAPVVTASEYRARLPKKRAEMQIIPVPARAFPAELRDDDLLAAPSRRSQRAVKWWAALSIIGLPWVIWDLLRKKPG